MVNDSFRALAHPIRRGIVEKLAAGPATVGEATIGFGVSKPAITKHLRVLEESGVVSRVRVGRTQRLSLEPAALSDATEWIDRQRALWERMFDAVDEYLKENKEEDDMTDQMAESPTELRLERTYNAPAAAVFEAWTSPEVMKRWFHGNPDWETPFVEQDLRVGGALRLTMRSPAGEEHTGNAVYTEISPPERLAFTWSWDDWDLGAESVVSVEFNEIDGETTVILTHSGLGDAETRDQHAEGWGVCLDNLASKVFAA